LNRRISADNSRPISRPATSWIILTEVYAPEENHQRHVNKVKAMINSVYDPTKPIQTYFASLQQAKDKAILLNIAYTERQLMYYAMTQFENQLTHKQAGKIERKWLELPVDTTTWAAFKMFWIKAILWRKYLGMDTHAANHAALERNNNDLASAMETVASIRHKNQLLAQQQHALSAHINHLHEASKANVCPAPPVHDTIPDNIIALTDILGRFAALTTATSPTTSSTHPIKYSPLQLQPNAIPYQWGPRQSV